MSWWPPEPAEPVTEAEVILRVKEAHNFATLDEAREHLADVRARIEDGTFYTGG